MRGLLFKDFVYVLFAYGLAVDPETVDPDYGTD
jgi:hypothetical protein